VSVSCYAPAIGTVVERFAENRAISNSEERQNSDKVKILQRPVSRTCRGSLVIHHAVVLCVHSLDYRFPYAGHQLSVIVDSTTNVSRVVRW
jgi:hypothetical protein